METAYLYAGYALEVTKRESRNFCIQLDRRILEACERYDLAHKQFIPCTANILCERTGSRHRVGCPESPRNLSGELGSLQW